VKLSCDRMKSVFSFRFGGDKQSAISGKPAKFGVVIGHAHRLPTNCVLNVGWKYDDSAKL